MMATMHRFVLSLVMGAALAATAPGCEGDGAGITGSAEATMASCNAFCTAYIAKSCSMHATVGECVSEDCGVIQVAPDRCQAKLKAYYDCRKAHSDVCDDGACSSELTAASVCM